MKKIFFLITFLCSNTLVADPGFYTSRTLPSDRRPDNLERNLNATWRIEIASSDCNRDSNIHDTFSSCVKGSCSGAVISQSGHVLTALHCLRGLTSIMPADDPGAIQRMAGKSGLRDWEVSWRITREQNPNHAHLPEMSIPDLHVSRPKIVFLGRAIQESIKGIPMDDRGELVHIPNEAIEAAQTNYEDFAIVKFKSLKSRVQCLPVSSDAMIPGDRVWGVGYPAKTSARPDGHDSDGRSRLISYGKIRKTFAESDLAPKLKLLPQNLRLLEELFIPAFSTFLSDIDDQTGSSGEPVINERGELVGIVSGSFNSGTAYVGGTTQALRAPWIVDRVTEKLGSQAAQEIFNCP